MASLYLNKDEGEQDEELEPLFQQRRHDRHSKGHVEVERVPGRTGITLTETCFMFHLIRVIMITATEVTRPGRIPKGIPRTRLISARKNKVKHSHILTTSSLFEISFKRVTSLWELSKD